MLTLTLAVLLLAGCQSDYGQSENPFPVAAAEYDRLFDAAQRVLRERGFAIDRANHRLGLIRTEPKHAPTAVEPIHNNNVGFHRQSQATVRHVRRIVTVSIEPDGNGNGKRTGEGNGNDPGEGEPIGAASDPPTVATTRPASGQYQLRVHVRLQAKQQPTRRLISGTGQRVFSTLDRVPKRWQQRGIESTYWQDIGQNPELENRLIHDIVRRSFDVPTSPPATQPAD